MKGDVARLSHIDFVIWAKARGLATPLCRGPSLLPPRKYHVSTSTATFLSPLLSLYFFPAFLMFLLLVPFGFDGSHQNLNGYRERMWSRTSESPQGLKAELPASTIQQGPRLS
jgi:hypothetical protein